MQIEILHQEVDTAGTEPSYYRMLIDRKHFKYISIDPGIYEHDDMCFPPALLEKLPAFPAGDWNYGYISTGTDNVAVFREVCQKRLPSIEPLWHPMSYDYLSLEIGNGLMSNVYEVSSSALDKPAIAKFTRFEWQIQYLAAETRAYSWIEGKRIGPKFLGHLTEEGRVIGFLLEAIEGRHATISDLPMCEDALKRLHALGILHGDINKHNFLVTERGVVLIDFETASLSSDAEAMREEMAGLEKMLLDESGRGSTYAVNADGTKLLA